VRERGRDQVKHRFNPVIRRIFQVPLSDSAGSRLHNPIRSRAASYNQAKRGRGPAPFGVGAGRDIVYPRRSCERDLDFYG
jgi:hypothetical protein